MAVVTAKDLNFFRNPFIDMFHCIEDKFSTFKSSKLPSKEETPRVSVNEKADPVKADG